MPYADPNVKHDYDQRWHKDHPDYLKKYREDNKHLFTKARKDFKDRVKASKSEFYTEWLKTAKCSRCDEDHPAVLDFHHRDPRFKKFTVMKELAGGIRSLELVKEEIAKCDLLCSNCHRKHHWLEKQHVYPSRQDKEKAHKGFIHGLGI